MTHLGVREAAEFRAENQGLIETMTPTGVHEIQLPVGMRVLCEVYVENYGNTAMNAFEQRFFDSQADLAFTWNTKEVAGYGGWSIIVRRGFMGDIPESLLNGVVLVQTIPRRRGGH